MTVIFVLAAVIAVLFLMAKTKADARMTYVDTQRAIRAVDQGTAKTMPSWSMRREETLVFFDGVQRMSERNGVSAQYIHVLYNEFIASRMLLLEAGEMESEGRSFAQQQLGVSELLLTMWSRLSEEDRQKFKNAVLPR